MGKRLSIPNSKLKEDTYYFVKRIIKRNDYRYGFIDTLIKTSKVTQKKVPNWHNWGYSYNVNFKELKKDGTLENINTSEIINNIRYYPVTINAALKLLPKFTVKGRVQKAFVRGALKSLSQSLEQP